MYDYSYPGTNYFYLYASECGYHGTHDSGNHGTNSYPNDSMDVGYLGLSGYHGI